MESGRNDRRCSAVERAAVAASIAQQARYRAAFEELTTIRRELVAETARLAARIEERLSPRTG